MNRWKLIDDFRQRLAQTEENHPLPQTFSDPRRQLAHADYLSLFLFGLLNPCVRTMRSLCFASKFQRVQQEVCQRHVSLGSFSETQAMLDPAVLKEVFEDLSQQVQTKGGDPRLKIKNWLIQDSTLWEALPRMHWAMWRTQGKQQQALRLHLSLHLLDDKPSRVKITDGRHCERAAWRQQWKKGDAYVGDRYFGEDYGLLEQLRQQECFYVIRLREKASISVIEELPLTKADSDADVIRQAWVQLGCRPRYRIPPVRVVWVQGPEEVLLLVTNQSVEEMSAELVSLLYKRRWQVELFFRWIKCILGNRHWLAESKKGVAIQIYLALIAALLLQLRNGKRPTKRTMEAIQLHMLGWVTPDELQNVIARQETGRKMKKS